LTQSWTEGNGKNPDLNTGTTTRGSGSGTTWTCAVDTNINNNTSNCSPAWTTLGGSVDVATAPAITHKDSSSGDIVWDVTCDMGVSTVCPGSPFGTTPVNGWIVKKVVENQTGGEVLYYSKEGATAISNMNVAPRLILYYQ
jgi:hypothetical protein